MSYRRTARRRRTPSTTAVVLVFLLALLASAGSLRAARAQDAAPRIGIPYGLAIEGAVSVSPGPTATTEYVVLGNVSVINPSRDVPQSFELDDWAIVDGDHIYHPAARKGLGAIDLSAPGIVFPLEHFRHTITFLVPRTLLRASLQFTPEWYDQNGGRIQFCCA
jgi:hypothetical protein